MTESATSTRAGYGLEAERFRKAQNAKHWEGLKLFLSDGRIEVGNNSVERTIPPIGLNRKKVLFAGFDAGAENWATIASLIEACKLNAVNRFAYLAATLTLSSTATGRTRSTC